MTHLSLKFWISMVVLTTALLGLGRLFDRKCRGGCLREVMSLNFEDSSQLFGESRAAQSKANKLRVTEPKLVDLNAERDNLPKLTVKSFVTDWVIRQGSENLSVTFSGYKIPEEWSVKREPGELRIETRKKGPRRAELELPAGFTGELELVNVSGEVLFEGPLNFKRLKVTNVSGLVTLQELPLEALELSTVTGSILASQNINRNPLNIEVQSVSGDVDLRLKADFGRMHVESVSGSVFLRLPESCSFTFNLESVSGNFSGFPSQAEESRDFGEKDLEGMVGTQAQGSLHFETISGEFQLMQDKSSL